MTTIAATSTMMAADSRVTVGETSYLSPKLILLPDAIVGAAGDTEACHLFFEWWGNRRTAELVIPKSMDLEALVLTRTGLYRYGKYAKPDMVKDGIMAVGTGAALAMASLDTMQMLGLTPDPRIAVEAACKRNPSSSLPVDHMTIDMIKADADVIPKLKRTRKK